MMPTIARECVRIVSAAGAQRFKIVSALERERFIARAFAL